MDCITDIQIVRFAAKAAPGLVYRGGIPGRDDLEASGRQLHQADHEGRDRRDLPRPAAGEHRRAHLPGGSLDGALKRSLGPAGWRPGMPVSCDICLQPCAGLLELGAPEVAVDGEASPAA